MITISLCMIVRNEEAVLGRCLDSAREIADEIIIVDTGSTDNTISIAKKFTDRVYSFEWTDDFSAARNFSYSKATKEYIMWLDADDIIDSENKARFLEIKKTLPPDTDVVMLPYRAGFDKSGRCTFSYCRERITRRAAGFLWQEPVHECLPVSGKVAELDAAVSHMPGPRPSTHSNRNLRIYRNRIAEGGELSARGRYYYARELKTHGMTDEAIEQYESVLRQGGLWAEDAITASGDLADCYMAKGEEKKALKTLFGSFEHDLPRAEILCRIGMVYVRKMEGQKAIYWYSLALDAARPRGWGFISEDYLGYIPHMQLCVLYDRAGDREKALFHHEKAKLLKPDSPEVAYNEEYFNRVKLEQIDLL